MSFSGGVYTLPGPALVTGEVVSATENNQFRNDVAGAFNLTMLRNGTSTATANLPMGGYKLTGLGAPSTNGDSLAYGAAAVVTTLTSTSLTATRVPYAGTGGLLQDASTFTFDGTTLTTGGFSTSGNISAATATVSGNITVSGGTANGVAYLNGSKVLTTGSALTFDGATLTNTAGGLVANGAATLTGAANAIKTLYLSNYADSAANWNYIRSNSGLFSVFATGSNSLSFGASGYEQMRLTSTGLGIGTSLPGYKLHIGAAGNAFSFGSTTSSTAYNAALINNAGGSIYFGVDNAAGTAFNGAAYAGVIGTSNSTPFQIFTNNVTRATFDSSGNLGLGVTPSAWGSLFKSLDLKSASSFSAGAVGQPIVGYNFYNDNSNNRYKTSNYASKYEQVNGIHQWYTAPSGTAGDAVSFTQAMTLDASGRLIVGGTSAADSIAQLTVAGPSTVLLAGGGALLRFNKTAGTDTGWLSNSSYGFHDGNGLALATTTADPLRFGTNNTERMRIDSSGNVGIGTSSPSYKLDATASGSLGATVDVARFYADAGSTAESRILFGTAANVVNAAIGAVTTTGTSGDLKFYTENGSALAERMRIDSSGYLLVGTNTTLTYADATIQTKSSSGWGFTSEYTGTAGTNGAASFVLSGGSTSPVFNRFQYGSTVVGYINTNGTSTTYSTSSDYRLKENIQPMQNALGVVAQLNPVTYTWKADGSDGQGFIAHELQAVVPDCVTGEKDAVDAEGNPVYQGIDTSFLVATLTKAIQEQQEQINQLKAEVAALKGA